MVTLSLKSLSTGFSHSPQFTAKVYASRLGKITNFCYLESQMLGKESRFRIKDWFVLKDTLKIISS